MKFFLNCITAVSLVFFIVTCNDTGNDMTNYENLNKDLKLTSSSFKADSAIPVKYTCDDPNQVFPQLSWNADDKDYKSFVLLMNDPDAIPVAGYVWDHWLIYDIPAGTKSIQEGSNQAGPLPAGTKRGVTSFGDTLYGGPCPPSGQLHHYHFKLYGLDIASTGLQTGADSKEVMATIKGHILDSAVLIGTFSH